MGCITKVRWPNDKEMKVKWAYLVVWFDSQQHGFRMTLKHLITPSLNQEYKLSRCNVVGFVIDSNGDFMITFKNMDPIYVHCAPGSFDEFFEFESMKKLITVILTSEKSAQDLAPDYFKFLYTNSILRGKFSRHINGYQKVTINSANSIERFRELNCDEKVILKIIDVNFRDLLRDTLSSTCLKIVDLTIQYANIRTISDEFKNLKCLKFLNVSMNSIENWKWLLCRSFRQSLQCLNISHNNINVFPDEILYLQSLYVLCISFNPITKLPPFMHLLKNLRRLVISQTKIDYLPETLNRLELIDVVKYGCEIRSESKKILYSSDKTLVDFAIEQVLANCDDFVGLVLPNRLKQKIDVGDRYGLRCLCGRKVLKVFYGVIMPNQLLDVTKTDEISVEKYFCSNCVNKVY